MPNVCCTKLIVPPMTPFDGSSDEESISAGSSLTTQALFLLCVRVGQVLSWCFVFFFSFQIFTLLLKFVV